MRRGAIVRTGAGGPWRSSIGTVVAPTTAGAGNTVGVTSAESFSTDTRADTRERLTSEFPDPQLCGTLRTTLVVSGADTSA
jgi:hypothetical protein